MNLIYEKDKFLLEEIVKRNFSSKYKDSVLGVFWSVLRPLLIMSVFTIIFSTLFGGNIENYPVYFLSGRCFFDFFTGSINVLMNALKGNKNILQKTAAPKYVFILGGVISEFLNFLITLVILVGVMLVTHATFYWSIMPIAIVPIISMVMIVTGLGFMFSILAVYYNDIQHLWGVISLVLMYGSALFYPMDIVPEPYRSYMILNPIYWVINQFRSVIYQGVIPELGYMINLLLISAMVLVFGIIVFKKYETKVSMRF